MVCEPMADSSSRQGERYATDAVLAFVRRVHAPHDEALQRAFDAPEREGMPAIQVGPTRDNSRPWPRRLCAA